MSLQFISGICSIVYAFQPFRSTYYEFESIFLSRLLIQHSMPLLVRICVNISSHLVLLANLVQWLVLLPSKCFT